MTTTTEIRPRYGNPDAEYQPCVYAMPRQYNKGTPLDTLHALTGVLQAGTSIYGEEYPNLERALPLRRLSLGVALMEQAEKCVERMVDEAREAGMTWDQIGSALGVTRQGAQQRWGK